MEINNQQITSPQSIPAGSAQNQKIANDQLKTKEQDTNIQNSGITVNLSNEAVRLSSPTEQNTPSQINSKEQAQKAVDQLKQDIERTPDTVNSALSGRVTADQVSNLIS